MGAEEEEPDEEEEVLSKHFDRTMNGELWRLRDLGAQGWQMREGKLIPIWGEEIVKGSSEEEDQEKASSGAATKSTPARAKGKEQRAKSSGSGATQSLPTVREGTSSGPATKRKRLEDACGGVSCPEEY